MPKGFSREHQSAKACPDEPRRLSVPHHVRQQCFEVLYGLFPLVLLPLPIDLLGLLRASFLHLPLALPQTRLDARLSLQLLFFLRI